MCVCGPARAALIDSVLQLWGIERAELAVDGCASSSWHAGRNPQGVRYDDLTHIFKNEARVERFMAMGLQARRNAERPAAKAVVLPIAGGPAVAPSAAPPSAPERRPPPALSPEAEAARERLRQYVARVRSEAPK